MTADLRTLLEWAGVDAEQRTAWRHQLPQRVRVHDDTVEYDYAYVEGPWGSDPVVAAFGFPPLPTSPPVRSGRTTLIAFLNLAENGPPERVAEFVLRHGPFELCAHGSPRTHRPFRSESAPRDGILCNDVSAEGTTGREPIDEIRAWARIARATVSAAVSLRSNEPAPSVAEEWEAVFGLSLPTEQSARERAVSLVLNDIWLPLGLVRPEVDLTAAPRVRTTHYGGLVGVLAVQLVRTALQADVAFCSVCLRAFETNSTPQQGRDAYCEDLECKRVRWRRAKARARSGAPKRRVRTRRPRGSTSVEQKDAR